MLVTSIVLQSEYSMINIVSIMLLLPSLLADQFLFNIYSTCSNTMALIPTINPHSKYINALQRSEDGTLLASTSPDGTLKLWTVNNNSVTLRQTLGTDDIEPSTTATINGDVLTQQFKNTLDMHRGLAISSNKSIIITGGVNSTIHIYRLDTTSATYYLDTKIANTNLTKITNLILTNNRIICAGFNTNNTTKGISIYDFNGTKWVLYPTKLSQTNITFASLSPDSVLLVFSSYNFTFLSYLQSNGDYAINQTITPKYSTEMFDKFRISHDRTKIVLTTNFASLYGYSLNASYIYQKTYYTLKTQGGIYPYIELLISRDAVRVYLNQWTSSMMFEGYPHNLLPESIASYQDFFIYQAVSFQNFTFMVGAANNGSLFSWSCCQSAYRDYNNNCSCIAGFSQYSDGQCYQCAYGLYYNSTTFSCATCNQSLYGCSLCTNNTVCLNCVSDYYYMQQQQCLLCYKILANCSRCTDRNTCIQCATGSFVAANKTCGTCSIIFNNCLSCNQSMCLKCTNNLTLLQGTCVNQSLVNTNKSIPNNSPQNSTVNILNSPNNSTNNSPNNWTDSTIKSAGQLNNQTSNTTPSASRIAIYVVCSLIAAILLSVGIYIIYQFIQKQKSRNPYELEMKASTVDLPPQTEQVPTSNIVVSTNNKIN